MKKRQMICVVHRVMVALEEIELNWENEHINMTFSAESFSLLIGTVKDYTERERVLWIGM